jgi:hypothetical protein
MDQEYRDNVASALGRIMGNLWSLEWIVRNALYLQGQQPHAPMPGPRLVLAAQVGAAFPENALTDVRLSPRGFEYF